MTQAPLPIAGTSPFDGFDYRGAGFRPTAIPVGDGHQFEGYVYVLGFGSAVKVGWTKEPRKRIGRHLRSSLRRNGVLRRVWVSPPHIQSEENERELIQFCESAGRPVDESLEAFAGLRVERVVAFARALPFRRFDVDQRNREREAAAQAVREYTARTGFGCHVAQFFDPEFILVTRGLWDRTADHAHTSLGALFGRQGDTHQVPQIGPEYVSRELLAAVAEARGESVEDLLDITYIDLLEEVGRLLARSEAARLKLHALQSGRSDLLQPLRDLTPTRAIEEAAR